MLLDSQEDSNVDTSGKMDGQPDQINRYNYLATVVIARHDALLTS